jgi:ankyrin repeat protein
MLSCTVDSSPILASRPPVQLPARPLHSRRLGILRGPSLRWLSLGAFALLTGGFLLTLPQTVIEPASSSDDARAAEADLVDAVSADDPALVLRTWSHVPLSRRQDIATFLIFQAANHENPRTLDLLCRIGVPIDVLSIAGRTALINAASNARPQAVDNLLRHGADPNATSTTGLTPLMAAADAGDLPCVLKLLAAGAAPDRLDHEARSAFEHAQRSQHPDSAGIIAALSAALASHNSQCPPLVGSGILPHDLTPAASFTTP